MTKLPIIILLLGLALYTKQVSGQCENGTHTDPRPAYVQPQSSGFKTNTFDWKSETFPIDKSDYHNFAPYVPGNPLYSPFYSNAAHLERIAGREKSDFKPENGWELIKQDFGYFYSSGAWNGSALAGVQYNKPVAYFMLYNKFQAKLRIMATVPLQGNIAADKVSVELEFVQNPSLSNYANFKVSALFNNYSPLAKALDQPTGITKVSTMALFPSSTQDFFFADFQLAFDPCVCFFESGFKVSFRNIVMSNIVLSGRLVGLNQSISSISSGQGNIIGDILSENYLTSVFTNPDNYAVGLNQTYKNLTALKNDMKANNTALQSSIDFLEDALKKFEILTVIPAVAEIKEPIEIVSKVLDFLSIVADETGGAGSNAPQPTVITGQLALSGKLETQTMAIGYDFMVAVPGSADANMRPEYAQADINGTLPNYPMYNEPLGLFALMKTPHINFFHQEPDNLRVFDPQTNTTYLEAVDEYNQYQLQANQFEFSFNPIVNPENTKIFAALEIEGVADWPGFETFAGNLYQKDVNNGFKRYMTKFFPLECIDNVITFEAVDYTGTQADYNASPHGSRKVNIILNIYYEFKPDAYGKVHKSIQIIKYPLIIDPVTNVLTSDPRYSALVAMPDNLAIHSTTYSTVQTIFSFGTITIDGTLSNNSGGQVKIIAEHGFNILPGAQIGPGITLEIGFVPGFCTSSPIQPIASNTLQTRCTSGDYQANQTSMSQMVQQAPSKIRDYETAITLYPNPAQNFVNCAIVGGANERASGTLVDVSGRVVKPLFDNVALSGATTEIKLDVNELPAGVYYCRILVGGAGFVKKLVIVK